MSDPVKETLQRFYRAKAAIAAALEKSELNEGTKYELSFHLAEILADAESLTSTIKSNELRPRDVQRMLDAILIHWPYHVSGLRKALRKADGPRLGSAKARARSRPRAASRPRPATH